MTDPVQPLFPSPPASNLHADPPAQPNLDAIIAQSLMDDLPAQAGLPVNSATAGLLKPMVSGPNKEAGPINQQEVTHLVEVSEHEPIPPEVEGWLQKMDTAGEIKLPEPITHDGNVLLAGPEAQVIKEKLVIPLSQTGLQIGLKAKVSDSARWLAEWCSRLVKTMKGEVKYAPERINGQT